MQIAIDSPAGAGLQVKYLGSQEMATGPTGQAAIFNVPPGSVTLTATPLDVGKPSAVATVFVRAGAGTLAMMPASQ